MVKVLAKITMATGTVMTMLAMLMMVITAMGRWS
jgi:hypothetical protein